MPTFDPNVFDTSTFDTIFPTPVIWKIRVPREMQRVGVGSAISVTIYLHNVDTTPGRRFPLNPDTAPQIQLYKPDSTILVAYANMFNQGAGEYSYQHQTALSDPVGPYTARFKCINGSKTTLSPLIKIFEVYT